MQWLTHLKVKASYPISVQMMVAGTGVSYTALPDQSLDSKYYALTLNSKNFGGRSLLIVTGSEPDVVNITFPFSNARCLVTYCDGSCLTYNVDFNHSAFNINAGGKSVCIASQYDLSGSFVSGSKPLILVAGNIRLAPDDYYVLAQMLPIAVWSTLYFVPPLPNTPYWLEIYSQQTVDLSVFKNVDSTPFFKGQGFAFWINFTDPYFIYATEPVMAIDSSYGTFASTVVLQSMDSLQPQYSFVVPSPSDSNLPQQTTSSLAITYNINHAPEGHICINSRNVSTYWSQSGDKEYWYTTVTLVHSTSYVVSLVCNQSTSEADLFGAYLLFTNGTEFVAGFPLAFGPWVSEHHYNMMLS